MTVKQYEPGPWVARPDGERIPVRSSTRVDVKLRNGVYLRDILAGSLNWSQADRHNDIMTWRLSRVVPPSAKSPVVPHINIVVNIDDESAEALRQNWIDGVRALQARFMEMTKNLCHSIQPAQAVLNTWLDTPGVSEALTKFHSGGLFKGSEGGLVGERPSPYVIPIAKTNLENESTPKIQPESKAEVQSEPVRRASQSEVDPDRAFERAYDEAFGHRCQNESAPEKDLESAPKTQSDFEDMAARICTALIVHTFENDAGAAKAISNNQGAIANFLRKRFDALLSKEGMSMVGVGDGSANLFVYGSSEACRNVRDLVTAVEKLSPQVKQATKSPAPSRVF